MTRGPNRARTRRSLTVGELEDLLNGLYSKLSLALRNPPPGQLNAIVTALNVTEWTLNQIIIQNLHQDAQILGKLTTQLKDPTNQLVQLKNTLQQASADCCIRRVLVEHNRVHSSIALSSL